MYENKTVQCPPVSAVGRDGNSSITDEATGCFNLPNPSSRIMALGSTQPLTEMSTGNLSGGKGAAGE
jgi:hypothetical protein